nr:MAG TPA: hypothetical protein [Bacteriophage sp.]
MYLAKTKTRRWSSLIVMQKQFLFYVTQAKVTCLQCSFRQIKSSIA